VNKFWTTPERGRTGDHGQAGADGRDGRQGEAGPRGPAGEVSQGERGERGKAGGGTPALRLRMLVLYVVLVLVLAAVLVMYRRNEDARRHFERAIIVNCEQTAHNQRNFNEAMDVIIERLKKATTATPEQRAEGIKLYGRLKSPVPTCPPRRSR
jgi:hypothetical protein